MHCLVAQMVQNLPEVQETQVWPLGREDLLEKGMATHSSILAWRIPRTEARSQSLHFQSLAFAFPSIIWGYISQLTGFPGGTVVKNLPAIQEMWLWSLDQEDLLEKGMATHSRVLAWKIPGTEEPGKLQSIRSQGVRQDWEANTFTFHFSQLKRRFCPSVLWVLNFGHPLPITKSPNSLASWSHRITKDRARSLSILLLQGDHGRHSSRPEIKPGSSV